MFLAKMKCQIVKNSSGEQVLKPLQGLGLKIKAG
jgi:hypothetical protein